MTDEATQGQQKPQPKKTFWGRLRRFFSKKWVIIMLLLIVLLAAGVGVGLWVSGMFSQNSQEASSNEAQPQESASTTELNTMLASGDAEGVAKKVATDSSLSGSLDGQRALAAAALNAGNVDEALQIFLAAGEQYGWTADMANQVALIYAGKGDRQQAIDYYEKEKTLLVSGEDNPAYDSELEAIDAAIKALL